MATVLSVARTNAALDALLNAADAVALYTAEPAADGTGDELEVGTAPGYARQAVSFGAAAAGEAASDIAVEFSAVGGNWPNVTHLGVWAGGTFIMANALTTARQINDGQTLRFAVGQLVATIDGIEVA